MCIRDSETLCYLSEDNVRRFLVIQKCWRSHRDVKLAAGGVGSACSCHRQRSHFVVLQVVVLVFNGEPRSAFACSFWVATLNHESVDDAVEDEAIVERLLLLLSGWIGPLDCSVRKAHEVRNRYRCLL